jgi:hypothetical protein
VSCSLFCLVYPGEYQHAPSPVAEHDTELARPSQ